jgi:hypothetical protein
MEPERRVSQAVVRALALVMVASAAGCGVITGGTTETITVQSVPSMATLTTQPTSGSFTTPASIELARKNSYTLIANREGYQEAQFQISQSMRVGPLILDILFTGLIGVVVDAATGGWWDLSPDDATMSLEPAQPNVAGLDPIRIWLSEVDDSGETLRVDASEPVHITVIQN